MIVDSYRFLPRSFRAAYELAPTDEAPVWAPFEPRLADATISTLQPFAKFGRQLMGFER